MDKELLEQLKDMSREERTEYFKEHKEELLSSSLENVNGGSGKTIENPNSDVPYKNNYYTSWGFVCESIVYC